MLMSHHLPLKPIHVPPPLSLLPDSTPKSGAPLDQDHVMTARCSQFPIQSLSQPSSEVSASPPASTCPLQPFLPLDSSIDHIKATPLWPSPALHHHPLHPHHHHAPPPALPPLNLDHSAPSSNPSLGNLTHPSPSLSLDSPLSSSCSSSLASSTHQSSYFSNNPPPPPSSSFGHDQSQKPPPPSAVQPGSRHRSDSSAYPPPPLVYPHQPAFSAASYPAPSQPAPLRPPSLSLAYPTTAYTPSGGSPPLPSSSATSQFFHLDSAGRRHTLSSFVSPESIELSLVPKQELDETFIKEEKRRRNKESSQRFRDRTRERQREKQERLEYLERRTRDLESELKASRARANGQDALAGKEEREMMETLRRENQSLRVALRRADEEILQLRLNEGGGGARQGSPGSGGGRGVFDIRHVYSSLTQLSPQGSNTGVVGAGSPQSSSPVPETNANNRLSLGMSHGHQRCTSPESDSPSVHQVNVMPNNLAGVQQANSGYQVDNSGGGGTYQQMSNQSSSEYCWPVE